ncbi:MAG: hypothetical protein MJ252_20995 [archaeon]|nr:hypothetical protein [archaeon]
MSEFYKRRFAKEPQLKIGSKTENVEYSTKNIDPKLNYLNRQLYAEESLKNTRKQRQLEEYSYYAKATSQAKNPHDIFPSKVNFDNVAGKIGQEGKEEDFYKYTQSNSKIHGNNIAMSGRPKDMRSMNYHGYNIINNDIFGFYNPEQKFPKTSYQANYKPKTLERSLADLTPEQFEDYKRFREQQLRMMNQENIQKEPMMGGEYNQQREREEYEKMIMEREKQREIMMQKEKREIPQNIPPEAMERERQMNPEGIPPEVMEQMRQREMMEQQRQIPKEAQPNYENDENYKRGYEQFLMEQQQREKEGRPLNYPEEPRENKEKPNPYKDAFQQAYPDKEYIPTPAQQMMQRQKTPLEAEGNNIPNMEENQPKLPNGLTEEEYYNYMKQREAEEAEIRRQQQMRQMQSEQPSEYSQVKLPSGVSDQEYLDYINFLRKKEEEANLKRQGEAMERPPSNRPPSNRMERIPPNDIPKSPNNDEEAEREKYLNYLKAQQEASLQNPEQDPEYLNKMKQYENIIQGNKDTLQSPIYERNTPQNPQNYHMTNKSEGQNQMNNLSLQGATPGRIDKSNYIQGNPCKKYFFNF